jgi:hypothetical protein
MRGCVLRTFLVHEEAEIVHVIGCEAVLEVRIRGYSFFRPEKGEKQLLSIKAFFKFVAACLVEKFFGLSFMGCYKVFAFEASNMPAHPL